LADGGYAFAHGPLNYASTQVQQFRHRWGAWVSSDRVRLAKFEPLVPMRDDLGDELLLMKDGATWIRPARLALAFDQDALPVVAFQKDATTISIRKFVASVKTEYTFAGISPVLFYNGTVVRTTGNTDVCCLYLKAGGTVLYARFQRENFGVEYALSGFPTGVALARLQLAEYGRINGVNYMLAYGIATDGRQVWMRSNNYEPDLVEARDKLVLDLSADGGDLFSGIVSPGVADKMLIDQSVEDGAFTTTVILASAPTDKLLLDQSAEDGAFVLTVIIPPSGVLGGSAADKLTLDQSVEDGLYVQTVVSGDNKIDKLTLDLSADSGSYP
jgi:hypothetical protein